jgi:hypothetical protein
MGFLEGFSLPNENSSSGANTQKITTASPATSNGFLKGFTVPDQAGQDKAQKIADINTSTAQAQRESNKANSFMGTISNAVKAVPQVTSKILPGVTQVVKDLKEDPFGLKAHTSNITNDIGNTVIDSIKKAGDSISNVFSRYSSTPGVAGRIGAGAQAVADIGGAVFSPITALFAGANDVPVLNSVTKILTSPFTLAGDVGKNTGGVIVDHLPISKESKDKIKGGVSDLLSLAAQLTIGGKMADVVTPDVIKIVDKIKAKYSPEDANTIVNKAHEIATEKIKNEVRKEPSKVIDEAIQKHAPKEAVVEAPKTQETKNTVKVYSGSDRPNGSRYFTADENYAKTFGKKIDNIDLPTEKVFDTRNKADLDIFNKVLPNERIDPKTNLPISTGDGRSFEKALKDAGYKYDAIAMSEGTGIGNDVSYFVSKDALTNLKPKTIDRPVLEDGTRVTKAANDINEQLVQKGVEQLPPEEQSKYQTGSYKKDLESTKELMNTDFQKAVDIATGKVEVPENIRYPQVLFNAIEAHAIKTGDVQLQMDLAKSPLGTQLSEAGGTLNEEDK